MNEWITNTLCKNINSFNRIYFNHYTIKGRSASSHVWSSVAFWPSFLHLPPSVWFSVSCITCALLLTVNAVSFYTCCCRKLIWPQQRPENATPRIALLVSVTYEALTELYWSRPASVLWSRGSAASFAHNISKRRPTQPQLPCGFFYPWWIIRGSISMAFSVWSLQESTCSLRIFSISLQGCN